MPRNASGTYTLPTGNPVVTGTIIESTWANGTMSDIASALTNSLARDGAGGMTAALRVVDGSVSVPGLAFANETGSGLYRSAAGDVGLAILGNQILRMRSTGLDVTGALAVSGAASVGGTLGVTSNTSIGGTLGVTGAATFSAGLTVTPGVITLGSAGINGVANADWGILYTPGKVGAVGAHGFLNAAGSTPIVYFTNAGNIVAGGSISATSLAGSIATGAGASGTWGISITGNAATVTNGVYNNGGTYGISISGNLAGTSISLGYSGSGQGISVGGQGGPVITSLGGGAAMMSFHRPGAYAINFGLGIDNQLRVGGWSRGGEHVILDTGNYNGWVPSLTGAGANGTWNINISGNAASASNAIVRDSVSVAGMESNDPNFMYMRRISDNSLCYIVRNYNGSLRNGFRNSGYLEWATDIGAVGTNYFVSDIRKKENIAPSTFKSSSIIEAIDFIEFDWKPESGNQGHVDVGVSAQQLQTLDARLVNELSDGSLMVNEPALVAHMAKAIKELLADVAALKAAAV